MRTLEYSLVALLIGAACLYGAHVMAESIAGSMDNMANQIAEAGRG